MPAAPRAKSKATTAKAAERARQPGKVVRARNASGVQLGEDAARALILQGAAVVFAKQGARLSSVEDILATSGVSRRTFYRLFEGKDDVLLALYCVGTEKLLAACRRAVAQSSDPLLRFERCVEAHLRNTRHLARLIFVLGGEAQRHESPLHTRRMHVHDELVSMLTSGPLPASKDPLAVRALILALEGIVRFGLQSSDEGRSVSDESLAQAKRVMMKLGAAAIA